MIYALDTNIISGIVNRNLGLERQFFETLTAGHQFALPLLVYYEVLRGLKLPEQQRKLELFERIASRAQILPLEKSTVELAARLYRELRSAGTPLGDEKDADVLIAAIVLEQDLPLVTRNTKHFARIPNLKLEDWTQ